MTTRVQPPQPEDVECVPSGDGLEMRWWCGRKLLASNFLATVAGLAFVYFFFRFFRLSCG